VPGCKQRGRRAATRFKLPCKKSVSQTFGQRFTISGHLAWAGDWPEGGSFNNAAFGLIGASYNLGAGVRFGGLFEPDNYYTY
jgi:hypothetical protein